MSKVQIPTVMKDGEVAEDPRLGRIPEFDEKSRDFPVRSLLSAAQLRNPRNKTWYLSLRLNQLMTSGCTGHSRTLDLAASPNPLKLPNGQPFDFTFADALYKLAQTLDEWPGESYDGSSVLGAFKATQRLGFTGEYRWAFGIDDVVDALSWIGPVVVGTDWLNSMFDTRVGGRLEVEKESGAAGGHAYMFRRVAATREQQRRLLPLGKTGEHLREQDILLGGTNSWWKPGDPMWGINGDFFMWASDLEMLLDGVDWPGEAAITTTAIRRA